MQLHLQKNTIRYAGIFIGFTIKTKETKIDIDVDIYAHHNMFEREYEQMAVFVRKIIEQFMWNPFAFYMKVTLLN